MMSVWIYPSNVQLYLNKEIVHKTNSQNKDILMRWLLYGSHGWIGGQIMTILKELHEDVIEGSTRADNYQTTFEEINSIKPDRVLCTIGRTSGPGCSNIDYLEQPGRLVENLRDNLHGPINLASICQQLDIHFTYLGKKFIHCYKLEHNNE